MSTSAPTADTPSYVTADFSLVPIGSSASSFAHEIAGVQRLVRESGLKNEMHATGTRVGKYPASKLVNFDLDDTLTARSFKFSG
ncbi:hypothetical protein PoHVEF18_006246 [Penicillium ochrochloron]